MPIATGSQLSFLLSAQQFFQPLERGEGTEGIVCFMKVNRCRLTLGQSQGRCFRRIFEPLQVHPNGPQINAADDPATLLDSAPAVSLPARLYHIVESHPGKGNEKVWKKPPGILPPECFCPTTVANRYFYPYIFHTLRVTVTARDTTVKHQRMNFSA